MARDKGLIRRITEAVADREDLEAEPVPTVDELVAFPSSDVDDPSDVLGTSYDPPGEEPEDIEEGELDEVSKKELELRAKRVHGGLSQTSKMPCRSFSLGAGQTCPAGSKMVRDDPEHAVCTVCFAKGGREAMPGVQASKKSRLKLLQRALGDPTQREKFVAEMVGSIQRQGAYFRWFDSGDIFRPEFLDLIVDIVRATPDTWHWIPTKQEDFVKQWVAEHGADELPPNANIRISAMLMNQEKSQRPPFTASSVYISKPPATAFACPATWDRRHIERYGRRIKTKAGPGIEPTCGPCRKCWERETPQVCYRFHGRSTGLAPELQKEVKGRKDVMGPILKKLRSAD